MSTNRFSYPKDVLTSGIVASAKNSLTNAVATNSSKRHTYSPISLRDRSDDHYKDPTIKRLSQGIENLKSRVRAAEHKRCITAIGKHDSVGSFTTIRPSMSTTEATSEHEVLKAKLRKLQTSHDAIKADRDNLREDLEATEDRLARTLSQALQDSWEYKARYAALRAEKDKKIEILQKRISQLIKDNENADTAYTDMTRAYIDILRRSCTTGPTRDAMADMLYSVGSERILKLYETRVDDPEGEFGVKHLRDQLRSASCCRDKI